MDDIPNWIWPSERHILTTGPIRFGRVLHWGFSLVAVLAAVGGVFGVFNLSSDQERLFLALLAALFTSALYLLGRGLLYIFAGE